MKIQVKQINQKSGDAHGEVVVSQEQELIENSEEKCCYMPSRRSFMECFDHRTILLMLIGICIFSYVVMYRIAVHIYGTYNQGPEMVYEDESGKLYHIHFSWQNCGSKSDPMKLTSLQVLPDPVHLNKNITIDLVSSLGIDIDAEHPISADITVERHIGFVWVEIPCIDEIGSCFYPDICKIIPFNPNEPCPDPFPKFNLPCHCPFRHGVYDVKNGTFTLTAIMNMIPLPVWLVSGDYYLKIAASRNGQHLGCYELYSSVKA